MCPAPCDRQLHWTVDDVFCRSGGRWSTPASRSTTSGATGPGISYALPAQAWVGPHHSARDHGIARAGIDALIELAVEKTPRGRTSRVCDNPQSRTRSTRPTRS